MKTHKPACHLLAVCCMLGTTYAAAPDGRLIEPSRAWLERYDPTLISSRYVAEGIYESYDDDSDLYKIENTLRWGIPLNDGHAFGIQAMLPVVSYNPRWDLLAESDRHRLELGATRVWGSYNEYAWSFGTEVPLSSESFEFKLATGFSWYF